MEHIYLYVPIFICFYIYYGTIYSIIAQIRIVQQNFRKINKFSVCVNDVCKVNALSLYINVCRVMDFHDFRKASEIMRLFMNDLIMKKILARSLESNEIAFFFLEN